MGRRILAGLAVAFVCCAAVNVVAQQVTFRSTHAVGDKIAFSQSTDLQMTMQAGGQQMQQTMRQVRSGTMTVEAVDAGGRITQATIAFGQDCGEEMDGGPQMGGRQTQPWALAGKTISIAQKGNDPKDLKIDGAEADPAAATEIVQLFRNENSMMPSTPVTVGDTWKLDAAQLQSLLPPGTQGDLQGTGKVTGVSNVNGREVATADLEAVISGNSPQGKLSMRFNGRGTFDTLSSRPIDLRLTGPFNASAQEMGPQGPVQMDINGQIAVAMKGSVTGTATANRPMVDPVAPPPTPRTDGRNPLDDAPPLPSAPTGVYSDGTLTLSLGDSGGSIKLGDREFPVGEIVYDADARIMSGQFRSGEQRFPFTATFNGDQCEFQSGTRKSTLKKQGARNPLDP